MKFTKARKHPLIFLGCILVLLLLALSIVMMAWPIVTAIFYVFGASYGSGTIIRAVVSFFLGLVLFPATIAVAGGIIGVYEKVKP